MSRFIIVLCLLLCSCTCDDRTESPTDVNGEGRGLRDAHQELEEYPSEDADAPIPTPAPTSERSSVTDRDGSEAPTSSTPASVLPPGTFYMPAGKQADLDRLVANVKVEQGWKLRRPEIVGNGENVYLRIENGANAVVLIMSPAEKAEVGHDLSRSFAIRVGNIGVDEGEMTKVVEPVIDAIKQNDPGGLWARSP